MSLIKKQRAVASAEMLALLRATADETNREAQYNAQAELATALTIPLRQGLMAGDIVNGMFERIEFQPGAAIEFPLDWLAPGTEKEYVAYTIPSQGVLPTKQIEADYVMVPTYEVGASITWLLKYARDARWDIVQRAMSVLESMFVKKMNDDCWHLILTALIDRNIIVNNTDASQGYFTKRLVSLLKTVMRRNGGGNTASINRARLTDLFVSPESMEDMRNWGIDIVDEITRREIYTAQDGSLSRVFMVNLHDLDELGENQEYQNFYLQDLGGSFASGCVELVVGLDLSKNDTFVMPFRQDIKVQEDITLYKERRGGVFAHAEYGAGILDNRRVLAGCL